MNKRLVEQSELFSRPLVGSLDQEVLGLDCLSRPRSIAMHDPGLSWSADPPTAQVRGWDFVQGLECVGNPTPCARERGSIQNTQVCAYV